ncbi:DUF6297 family protein [Nonomuraea sp. NPDC050404]|uniref:DUF6297 family protein n=1 Tax=Nonomuraea sp. NPDC050404 TaxID=3155783 RepID=UPI0033F5B5A6
MTEPNIRTVRAYLRSRGRVRAGLMDRYVTLFCMAMFIAVAGQPLSVAVGELAVPGDPARMGAGVALLALALSGFLATARTAGPVLLPSSDASWLLLSPLNRRQVLSRTARLLLGVAVLAGVVLGIGLLAVLGAPDPLVWRVLGVLVVSVAATVGGMALAVLGQASQSWKLWLTGAIAVLLVLAAVAVTGQLRTVLAIAASAPLPVLATAASGAAVLSGLLVRQAWASLDRIPTHALLTSSTRAGHVAGAAVSLDPGMLSWIAEDNHWRTRKLGSRRWPPLPAPFALAWQDWRRLARRPGRLLAIAATAALPAVVGQTGASPAVVGLAVLAGALAVAALSTSGARRDADNPALARMIGVGLRPALAARAVLPALLSGVWAAGAAAGMAIGAGLGGGGSWLLGLLAAPALAAAALRMARREPVDHSMPVLDTPMGSIPTGPFIWASKGPDLALLGCLPTAVALATPSAALAPFLVAQGMMSAVVLVAYVWRAHANGGSAKR